MFAAYTAGKYKMERPRSLPKLLMDQAKGSLMDMIGIGRKYGMPEVMSIFSQIDRKRIAQKRTPGMSADHPLGRVRTPLLSDREVATVDTSVSAKELQKLAFKRASMEAGAEAKAGTRPKLTADREAEVTRLRDEQVERTPKHVIPHVGAGASPLALNVYFDNRTHSGRVSENIRFMYGWNNNQSVDPHLEKKAPIDYTLPEEDSRTLYERIMEALESPTWWNDFMENVEKYRTAMRESYIDNLERFEQVDERYRDFKRGEVDEAELMGDQDLAWAARQAQARHHMIYSALMQGKLAFVDRDGKEVTEYKRGLPGGFKGVPMLDENGNEIHGLASLFTMLRQPDGKTYEKEADTYMIALRIIELAERAEEAAQRLAQGTRDLSPIEVERLKKRIAVAKNFPGGWKYEDAQKYVTKKENDSNSQHLVEFAKGVVTWNNGLIDLMRTTGIISDELAADWYDKVYIPFTKNHELEPFKIMRSRLKRRDRLSRSWTPERELEGSLEPIDEPLIERMLANLDAIVGDAMLNVAYTRMAEKLVEMGEAEPASESGPDTIKFTIGGEAQYVSVKDPLLVKAAMVSGNEEMLTGILKWIGPGAARVLRESVTRNPAFLLRNIARDTVSAFVTSGSNYAVVIDTLKNMNKGAFELARERGYALEQIDSITEDVGYRDMMVKLLKHDQPTNPFMKAWEWTGEMSRRSDAATRTAVYEDVLHRTDNEIEAIKQAFEIINFGRRGANPIWRVITASVPFLNARIQGLDVLYRAATGRYTSDPYLRTDPQEITRIFARRGAFLAAMTGLYWMAVHDDEWYKNMRDELKDDYWFIPTGTGALIKYPIPFEVGLIFKTLPEQMIRVIAEEGFGPKDMRRDFGRAAFQSAMLDPTPQIFAPFLDAWRNRSSYTGRPIVPEYMVNGFEPEDQRDLDTNEFAAMIGAMAGWSPKKVEYVLDGYFGPIGGFAAMVADKVARMELVRDSYNAVAGVTPLGDLQQSPTGGAAGTRQDPFQIDSMPVVRSLLMRIDDGGGYQSEFYDLRNEVDQAVTKINKARKEYRTEDYRAALQEQRALLNVKGTVRRLDRYMARWRQRRDRILMSKHIPADDKRRMLRRLEQERDMQLAIVPRLMEFTKEVR
jgi:hypothetical protein